ncbi:hypothetical protein D3C75_933270 [compost metagenome]
MAQTIISVFSSSDKSRSSRLEKIETRDNLVREALDEILANNLAFSSKKRLLVYIAKFVSNREYKILTKGEERLPENISKCNVTVGGLYKSQTYMARVDLWILNNPKAVKRSDVKAGKSTAQLRLKLSELSNQNERLRLDLYQARNLLLSAEIEEAKGVQSHGYADLYDAYFVIDALLLEFGEFVLVDATGISVNNSIRRFLVGAEPISGYLKWRGKVI